MKAIYWFRQDLRTRDNRAWQCACQQADVLLPTAMRQAAGNTRWGFERVGPHRRRFRDEALYDLNRQLQAQSSLLYIIDDGHVESLIALAHQFGLDTVICEAIAAPEELQAVDTLRQAGLKVITIWQSTLLPIAALPFDPEHLPDQFTPFRHAVEKADVTPEAPLAAPTVLPSLPADVRLDAIPAMACPRVTHDDRSSVPFAGGETAGLAHLEDYFSSEAAHHYKATRNGLHGFRISSKWSLWLAQGAFSACTAYAALKDYERRRDANEGTYWLWFELLWRDYFALLHLKYGRRLYAAHGLRRLSTPKREFDIDRFAQWTNGTTGVPLVDAGMHELSATGYLSNRMRQITASYWVNELEGDWQAGAAWFESQLIDYDVYSNQGNWLYLSGHGTDPRGGRHFNIAKQMKDYDPEALYCTLWANH